MKYKIYLFILFTLTSCSFNRIFYQADKMPATVKQVTITNNYSVKDNTTGLVVKDSSWKTLIHFGDDFQPTFTDDKNNLLPLDYTVEGIVFKNEQDKKLSGWFFKPKNVPDPAITILFLHGNGGDIITHYPAAVQLAEHGFQVFIFDYSGYGFSEAKPTRKHVLEDATAALNMIRSRADVKHTKVVIYGQSLGGHLAAVAAQKNEPLVDGVVIEGAFSSHKDIAAHSYPPLAFAARVLVKERYSAFRSVRNFHKPVLVIHSSEDRTAPFWMGRKIYDNANQPKSFYEIKQGHIEGLAYYADSIAYKIREMGAQ